jgi:hypothetical protein
MKASSSRRRSLELTGRKRVPLPEALERIENGAKATGGLTHFRLLYHRVYVYIIDIIIDIFDLAAAATGGSALVLALVLR